MTRVRADVFPARVTINPSLAGQEDEPQVLDKVRVVVTVDALLVYKDSAQGPALAYHERLASYDPGNPPHRRTRANPARPASATTDSGAEVTWSRSAGCGCGSRLRAFNPFAASSLPTVGSTRDA